MATVQFDLSAQLDGPIPATFDGAVRTVTTLTAPDGGGLPRIAKGGITIAPTSTAAYAGYVQTPDLGAPVSEVTARFHFDPQGRVRATRGGSVVLAVYNAPLLNGNAAPLPSAVAHVWFGPDEWEYDVVVGSDRGYRPGANPFARIAGGRYPTPLTQSAVAVYRVGVRVQGGTATILLPDGSSVPVSDARFGWAGMSFAFWEVRVANGLTDAVPRIVGGSVSTGAAVPTPTPVPTPAPVDPWAWLWKLLGLRR